MKHLTLFLNLLNGYLQYFVVIAFSELIANFLCFSMAVMTHPMMWCGCDPLYGSVPCLARDSLFGRHVMGSITGSHHLTADTVCIITICIISCCRAHTVHYIVCCGWVHVYLCVAYLIVCFVCLIVKFVYFFVCLTEWELGWALVTFKKVSDNLLLFLLHHSSPPGIMAASLMRNVQLFSETVMGTI